MFLHVDNTTLSRLHYDLCPRKAARYPPLAHLPASPASNAAAPILPRAEAAWGAFFKLSALAPKERPRMNALGWPWLGWLIGWPRLAWLVLAGWFVGWLALPGWLVGWRWLAGWP